MRLISIMGDMTCFDKVVSICGHSQVFQPEDVQSFYADAKKLFSPIIESNPYQSLIGKLDDTLFSAGKKIDVSGKPAVQSDFKTLREYVGRFTDEMGAFLEKEKDLQKNLEEKQTERDNVSHFMGLDLNLKEIFSCEFIKVRFGKIPKENYDRLKRMRGAERMLSFRCTADKTHYWGAFFTPAEFEEEMDRILASLYFERLWLISADMTPEETYAQLEKEITEIKKNVDDVKAEMDEFWVKEKDECTAVYNTLLEQDTCFGIRRYGARYHSQFLLAGWVLAEQSGKLIGQLRQIESVECMAEDANSIQKHQAPTLLRNRRIAKPFEMFVDMYGLPSYGDIDPTPFVAITYILLFGIMFADLGQGLAVSLVGLIAWKLKKSQLGRILIRCGISAAVFGLVFGSVFGFEHVLDPMYRAMGFSGKPIEVMEAGTINMIIYSAVGVGLVLIVVAMLINIYASFRRRDFENAIFGANGIAGLVFYASLAGGLVSTMLFGQNVFSAFYILGLIVLPLILIFLREPLGKLCAGEEDWMPGNIGDYVMQNFFELFEVLLSYVTNTMSFLRVGAFVLVHAGMMLVVFTLAEMTSGVGYAVIVAIGNVVVIGLEGLLVGIQVMRLEFYEMFSRFFEGQGKVFTPVRIKAEQKH